MEAIQSDEVKRDAVLIAQKSVLTMRQVSSDLGFGLSTLNMWVKMVVDAAGPPDTDQNLMREKERLRRENRILNEERELPKKCDSVFRGPWRAGAPLVRVTGRHREVRAPR
jgi:transposase